MGNITDNRKEYQPSESDALHVLHGARMSIEPDNRGYPLRAVILLLHAADYLYNRQKVEARLYKWKLQAIEPRCESSQGEC